MLSSFFVQLFSLGSTDRAGICTSTAVNAGVGINYEFAVSFGDRFNRTAALASAAGNAVITDFVCHSLIPP